MKVSRSPLIAARLGALCYIAWGVFHIKVAHDIYLLGTSAAGIAQGRLYQLAGYMVCIAGFAMAVGAFGNWRNDWKAYWLNLLIIGWADLIWIVTVVLPGYAPLFRGLLPPAIYILGAILTTAAQRSMMRPRTARECGLASPREPRR